MNIAYDRFVLADASDDDIDGSVKAIVGVLKGACAKVDAHLHLAPGDSLGTSFRQEDASRDEAGWQCEWTDQNSTCVVTYRFDEILGVAFVQIEELLPGLTAGAIAPLLSERLSPLPIEKMLADFAANPGYKTLGRLVYSQGNAPSAEVLAACESALASDSEQLRRTVAHVTATIPCEELLALCKQHLASERSPETRQMFETVVDIAASDG